MVQIPNNSHTVRNLCYSLLLKSFSWNQQKGPQNQISNLNKASLQNVWRNFAWLFQINIGSVLVIVDIPWTSFIPLIKGKAR